MDSQLDLDRVKECAQTPCECDKELEDGEDKDKFLERRLDYPYHRM